MWWYRYKLPDTQRYTCTQHFLSLCAICAAGRSLAACLSLHFLLTLATVLSGCVWSWRSAVKYPAWVGGLVSGVHHKYTELNSVDMKSNSRKNEERFEILIEATNSWQSES